MSIAKKQRVSLTNPQVVKLYNWVTANKDRLASDKPHHLTIAQQAQDALGFPLSASSIGKALRDNGVRYNAPRRERVQNSNDLLTVVQSLVELYRLVGDAVPAPLTELVERLNS